MTLILLTVAFVAVLLLMLIRRRHLGRLSSIATLLATLIGLILMQDSGLLPGTKGPLTHLLPPPLPYAR